MKTKTVKRHYCDHCKRGMFQRPAMERHERVCYRNPQRGCPMCANEPHHAINWEEKLKRSKTLQDVDKSKSVETDGPECPNCLWALVVLNNSTKGKPWVYFDKERLERDRNHFRSEYLGNLWHNGAIVFARNLEK